LLKVIYFYHMNLASQEPDNGRYPSGIPHGKPSSATFPEYSLGNYRSYAG
jgi:hypothetical protein